MKKSLLEEIERFEEQFPNRVPDEFRVRFYRAYCALLDLKIYVTKRETPVASDKSEAHCSASCRIDDALRSLNSVYQGIGRYWDSLSKTEQK